MILNPQPDPHATKTTSWVRAIARWMPLGGCPVRNEVALTIPLRYRNHFAHAAVAMFSLEWQRSVAAMQRLQYFLRITAFDVGREPPATLLQLSG
jgi:hypothetical protein